MSDSIRVRDITDTDTHTAGWWLSADGQGQIDMTGMTLPAARDELLAQCADEDQRQNVLGGTIEVRRPVAPEALALMSGAAARAHSRLDRERGADLEAETTNEPGVYRLHSRGLLYGHVALRDGAVVPRDDYAQVLAEDCPAELREDALLAAQYAVGILLDYEAWMAQQA